MQKIIVLNVISTDVAPQTATKEVLRDESLVFDSHVSLVDKRESNAKLNCSPARSFNLYCFFNFILFAMTLCMHWIWNIANIVMLMFALLPNIYTMSETSLLLINENFERILLDVFMFPNVALIKVIT